MIVPIGRSLLGLVLLSCAALLVGMSPGAVRAAERPNIVFLLADDLGYGDLSCFGQKRFETPHIDRIAREGMRFTQHYSGSPVCAPSRCVLMTGLHPGHAFIRTNREHKPEGQHPIPLDTVTLPKLLTEGGYVCGGFGKWGLGGPDSSGEPLKQGFQRFFGYNCQRVAHNYYPPHLWDNNRRLMLNNPDFSPHQKLPPDADPNDPKSYESYSGMEFAPDLIADQAVKFIEDNQDRPFFLYFPTTIPHLALQVPDDSLQPFEGKFEEEPYTGDRSYLPHRTPRAAYAAMVTRLDRYVGRLLAKLDELSLSERTIVVFSSDNGPLYDRLGGTDSDFFNSAAGLRGRKGSLYEGGFRVPMVIRWPGKIKPATVSDRVTGFEDWLPTLLELSGLSDKTPEGIDGISFAPTLRGQSQAEREFLYREFPSYGGQQSIRIGDWKAVRQNLVPPAKAKAKGGGNNQPDLRIALYNLKDDPAEERDVAEKHPEIVSQMERTMRQQHRASEDFPLPALDSLP